MTLTRTFHPVGQGGFASEVFEGTGQGKTFVMVYDCGALKGSERGTKYVERALPPNTEIDLLVISHFDQDHVSYVSTLASKYKVKACLLPLIHNEIFCQKMYQRLGWQDSYDLLRDPGAFFGRFKSGTKIIYVSQGDPGDEPMELPGDLAEPTSVRGLEKIKDGSKLSSGSPISFTDDFPWMYLPYNFKYEERSQQIRNLLNISEKGFDPEDFDAKALKDAYKKVDGTVNENSLALISVPRESQVEVNGDSRWVWRDKNDPGLGIHRFKMQPGCIFTGDGTLSRLNFKEAQPPVLGLVSTFQIPHHGSQDSNYPFKPNLHGRMVCPLHYGETNTFGHPSPQVLAEIGKLGWIPFSITEKTSSIFISVFDHRKEHKPKRASTSSALSRSKLNGMESSIVRT